MSMKRLLWGAVLSLAVTSLAHATAFSWNFDLPAGSQASPHVYMDTSNLYSLTAYGYTTASGPTSPVLGQTWGPGGGFNFTTGAVSAHNLYGKNEGAGETGLGLADLPSNEIQYRSFVQLDLTNLYANGFTSLTMGISSMQAGEGYYLWGSNTLGTPGALLRTRLGTPVDDSFSLPSFGTYTYFAVSATPIPAGSASSDVLILNGLTADKVANPVPEPASAFLLGTGLIGAAGLGLRRRRKSVRGV